MLRSLSIILLCTLTALASGAPQFLHLRQHERDDARYAFQQLALSHHTPHTNFPTESQTTDPHHHNHSEQDCPICTQFHAPLIAEKILLWQINIRISVPSLTSPPNPQLTQRFPDRLLCRGPPPPLI
jgi:hypothetical protein